MDYLICCTAALIGSGLTLFSGFGLGTLMTPVFALFFPVEVAIALTAIVHFLNNIFKLILTGRHANKQVIVRFGIPSILAAFLGAFVLKMVSHQSAVYTYTLTGHLHEITVVKLIISVLLLFFSCMEVIPRLSNMQFDQKWLPLGGLLSGFFGGLSGNQGALRSAFLSRAGLSKEAFIGTGVVIACCIDISRLSVYSSQISDNWSHMNPGLILASTLSAFAGAFIGNRLLKKVTITGVQYTVTVMLFIFALLLGAGII